VLFHSRKLGATALAFSTWNMTVAMAALALAALALAALALAALALALGSVGERHAYRVGRLVLP
jgi:hypothetical protein